ncbi:MAG: glycosyltransferase family 39 protein [Candidatus Omnitrophota bacterium]
MYNIKKYIREKEKFLIPVGIFLLGFAIRSAFALKGNDILSGDEIFYESSGRGLCLGKGYMIGEHLTSSIMPGYSIFIAFIYRFFQDSLAAIRIAQAVLDSLMCIAIYEIARKLFDKRVGFLSAILCMGHYFFLKSIQLLRPDSVQMFFVITSILYWIKWDEKLSKRDAFLFGCFSSLSIMFKPNMFFLPFIFLFTGFTRALKKRQNHIKSFIIGATVSIVMIVLPISIWTLRNYRVHNALVPFTTGFGTVLYHSYNPIEGKKFGIIPKDELTEKAGKIDSEVDRNRYLVNEAVKHIREHPDKVMKLVPLKILFFWSIFDWETLGGEGVYNFSTAFILPFSILGLIFLRKSFKRLTALLIPIVYCNLLAVVFSGLPRFRLPIEPILIIFAAYSMTYLYYRFSRSKIVLLVVSWFCLNFYMFMNSSSMLGVGKFLMESLKLW